jgi:hypothetical protein
MLSPADNLVNARTGAATSVLTSLSDDIFAGQQPAKDTVAVEEIGK